MNICGTIMCNLVNKFFIFAGGYGTVMGNLFHLESSDFFLLVIYTQF